MSAAIKNIAFAGSGNVAWHLSHALKQKGFSISAVWSRNHAHASALAASVGSKALNRLIDLPENADMVIIAVSDAAIAGVAQQLGGCRCPIVHTAGSVLLDVLKAFHQKCGVLYPLQTFSKDTPVDITAVPFFTEASDYELLTQLKAIAGSLSMKVYEADSFQRMKLHVAAVFAGNYTNYMYSVANELLDDSQLPREAIKPLITETAAKALTGNPAEVQTGPARRNDLPTITKHLEALSDKPELAGIYKLLAEAIIRKYSQ